MKGRLWTSVYLAVLVWPLPGFLSRSPSAAEVALVAAGLVCFAALYLRVVWTALDRPHGNATPYALVLLYAAAAGLAPALGELWVFAASFFLVTALSAALPARVMPAGAALTVGGVALALPLLGAPLSDSWWIPLQAAVFAGAMRAFLALTAANRALSRANAEVERLAVDNERLRFARDMHDILGHSLAVMTLKSQLAGKLLTADPPRAAAEIGDVEDLSRQALSDVRDAIAGYRELSLPDELDGARRALAAAGVPVEVSAEPVPAEVEPVLAWVVREGATNVVRHSRARRCRIGLGTAGGEAYVEVTDDGRGSAPGDGGTGLRGLAERVELAGGTLHGGPAEHGGFRLHARVPLPARPPREDAVHRARPPAKGSP
ncbi:sensor histidine kinase [Nonomuraea harbinensis]|uniref:Sensor histidine kinase n=1 Tax=Nonomuraea harbinensis TaxID=1286938 RepID=A0ABW1C5J9_9ACTN|nr:sensor histidine kinase [Nonomuraea harbinensis]